MEVFLILSIILSAMLGFFLGGPLGVLIGGIFGCLLYLSILFTRIWFIVEEKNYKKNGRKRFMISNKLKTSLAEAYNGQSQGRDDSGISPWKVEERDQFLRHLETVGAQNLLELGCGPGRDSLFFKEQGLVETCIDISPSMIERCKEKGLNAHVMSFDQLDFEDNSFDAIWALNTLLHVPKANLPHVLEEIHRVMKPGASFFMGVYGGVTHEGVWEDDFHEPPRYFSFYLIEDLLEIVKAGFKVESCHEIPAEQLGGGKHTFQSFLLKKTVT